MVISLFHGKMNITLKYVKKQKVTKHLASNNINVIHQQYPGLLKSLQSKQLFSFALEWKMTF